MERQLLCDYLKRVAKLLATAIVVGFLCSKKKELVLTFFNIYFPSELGFGINSHQHGT
jgi:hypothetical protein